MHLSCSQFCITNQLWQETHAKPLPRPGPGENSGPRSVGRRLAVTWATVPASADARRRNHRLQQTIVEDPPCRCPKSSAHATWGNRPVCRGLLTLAVFVLLCAARQCVRTRVHERSALCGVLSLGVVGEGAVEGGAADAQVGGDGGGRLTAGAA